MYAEQQRVVQRNCDSERLVLLDLIHKNIENTRQQVETCPRHVSEPFLVPPIPNPTKMLLATSVTVLLSKYVGIYYLIIWPTNGASAFALKA